MKYELFNDTNILGWTSEGSNLNNKIKTHVRKKLKEEVIIICDL